MGVDEFWAAFCAATGHAGGYYEATAFGADPAMQDELCELVLRGIKRATASAAFLYGEERVRAPKPGDFSIMLDGRGEPRGVFETVAVFEAPFYALDAQFAADEGEGDGSLAYWRREHERYFTALLAREGLEFSENLRVICERFRLVWVPH
jgi:uncharacterized protein YhfF